jgi:hypothetical protein
VLLFRPHTYTNFLGVVNETIRPQRESQVSGLVSIKRGGVGSLSPPSEGWLEISEMAMVGMGGGFEVLSSPYRNPADLFSDFLTANDFQKPLKDFGIIDDYLENESRAALNLWPLSEDGFGYNYDFVFDFNLNSAPSIPS